MESAEGRRQPTSDRWTGCRLGHLHWGANGGAGLLLRHAPRKGLVTYLLTLRSRWVDHGGTWGIPGGALHPGETTEAGAERESGEEIWPVPPHQVTGVETQDCGGGWLFRIVHADVEAAVPVYGYRETDATGWFPVGEMGVLPLHPGLRAWVEAEVDRAKEARESGGRS